MIIDSHAHWLPQDIIANAHFFSKAWGELECQLKAMDEAGVAKALLSYPTSDAHLKLGGQLETARLYNDAVAGILRRYPGRFIAAAALPPGDASSMLDEFKRCHEELGFQAVSLASSYDGLYLDDPAFLALYAELANKHTPVFVHSQTINPIGYERVKDPLLTPVVEYVFDMTACIGRLLMSGVFTQYQMPFIFANFGGVISHLAGRFDATYEMLRGINFVKDLKALPSHHLKNIYLDTGGDLRRTNFLAALDLVGSGHLVWGSDWPAKKDVPSSIAAVEGLEISAEEKSAVLGRNLAQLFGLS